MDEIRLLENYLGVHPNSEIRKELELRINKLKTKTHGSRFKMP